MNVLSLFDGISCGRIALGRAGIKTNTYYASEIDKYAIEVTQNNFPDTIQLGDVTKWREWNLSNIDLLIGGSPCFVAGTKVITSEGYKNIEDVAMGDYVLTHKNRYRKVLKTGSSIKTIYKLKAQGICETQTTSNHPYYTREVFKNNISEPKWKPVEELTNNSYICIPILNTSINKYNLTKEDCWLLGRYVADGHYRKSKRKGRINSYQYQVIYSVGISKLNYFKEKVKRNYSCYLHSKSVYRCVINSMNLVNFIIDHNFGKGALNKRIPQLILDLPIDLAKEFLDGYMSGDGSVRDNVFRATSVSKELIMGLNILIAKCYNVNSGFEFTRRKNTTQIEGRIVNQNDTYTTTFRKNMKKRSWAIVVDDKIWLPVKSVIKTSYIAIVYNLEVEEDNSYTANNAIVHNCQGFSYSGKGLNFNDERSKLFFEYVDILKHYKPKYFLLENVKMKKEWQDIITSYIGVEPIYINSKLVSAQERKRLYWTNIPNVTQPEDKNILFSNISEDGRYCGAMRGRRLNSNGSRSDYNRDIPIQQYIECRKDDKSNCLTTVQKDNVAVIKKISRTLASNVDYRYLTSKEYEILQTVPIGYTAYVPDHQRKRLLGNAWTVDVIVHILSNIKAVTN